MIKNALSIDLEDWYHPEFVRNKITRKKVPQINRSTKKILDLLEKYDVRATFFILGEIAERHPSLLKNIHAKGHEIACHGFKHLPLWNLTTQEFKNDISKFREVISRTLGDKIKIHGFRAPTFSMDQTTIEFLKCLTDLNFKYDSSVFPVKTGMYGTRDAPLDVYRPNLRDLTKKSEKVKLIEFPLTVLKLGCLKIPVSGGFYLRVFPYFIYKRILKSINRQNRPFLIYFHPWETHPSTPRVSGIGLKKHIITYYGINSCLKKIEKLIQDFKFEPLIDIIRRKEYEGSS